MLGYDGISCVELASQLAKIARFWVTSEVVCDPM
jgi:hypothetical protein